MPGSHSEGGGLHLRVTAGGRGRGGHCGGGSVLSFLLASKEGPTLYSCTGTHKFRRHPGEDSVQEFGPVGCYLSTSRGHRT